jgi:hypothetical protein
MPDFRAARSLLHALQRRVAHTAELAAIEIRYATISALGMLLLIIVASATVVIRWVLLVAALVIALVAAGFSWQTVTLGLAAVHVFAAIVGERQRFAIRMTGLRSRKASATS